MSAADLRPSVAVARLLPFTASVFLGFLAIGIPLPVLPLQVHDALGYGPVVVGLVMSVQSLATLLTRQHAGRLCDARGPKPATLGGFAAAACAGLLYLASDAAGLTPPVALGLLVAGRLVLGLGESLFITGLAAWSIARVGPAHAGRALSWQGLAMYGAIAVGAPLGGLAGEGGFAAMAWAVVLCPLLGGVVALLMPGVPAPGGRRMSFLRVLRAIWLPGLALALASSGFGTLAAFLALRYGAQGWPRPGLALTAFGAAYIAMRLLFGGLPDRLGGRRVACLSLPVEAVGLVLIWAANSPAAALAGAVVAGLGYSLVFPALGVEAVRLVAPENRGLALGGYLACFDLGLGAAGPVAGLAAGAFGLPAAFLAAATAALLSCALVLLAVPGARRRA